MYSVAIRVREQDSKWPWSVLLPIVSSSSDSIISVQRLLQLILYFWDWLVHDVVRKEFPLQVVMVEHSTCKAVDGRTESSIGIWRGRAYPEYKWRRTRQTKSIWGTGACSMNCSQAWRSPKSQTNNLQWKGMAGWMSAGWHEVIVSIPFPSRFLAVDSSHMRPALPPISTDAQHLLPLSVFGAHLLVPR